MSTPVPTIGINALPSYLIKPLQKSRVRKPFATLAFVHLRADTGFVFQLAISEHVAASRRFSPTDNSWDRWNDRKFDDHDAALTWASGECTRLQGRSYVSLTSQPLLIPLNETDIRHLRNEPLLPRWALEYASDLFQSIETWYQTEVRSAAAPPAGPPSTPPTPPTGVPPVPGESVDDVMERLKAGADSLGNTGTKAF